MIARRYPALAALLLSAFLTACAPQAVMQSQNAPRQAAAEKLGTQWGDEVSAPVKSVSLRRLSEQAVDEKTVYYSAAAAPGRSLQDISLAAGRVSLSVQDDGGRLLPIYRDNGRYHLHGRGGQAYQLVYENRSAQTYEIVASVDGLDVINGRAASRQAAGYVLHPYSSLRIEGFRKNENAVASFIFSAPKDAYAARSAHGDARNIGVIGTVVYELYDPAAQAPDAFPADSRYAPAPR